MRRSATALTLMVFAALLAMLAARGVRAEEVWRCAAPGAGASLYSDQPCPASGRALWLADERSPQQVAAAQRLAARESATAQRWRAEREARERAAVAASSMPVSLGPRARIVEPRAHAYKPHATSRNSKLKRGAASDTGPAAVLASPRARG